jgi:hypothetical protein
MARLAKAKRYLHWAEAALEDEDHDVAAGNAVIAAIAAADAICCIRLGTRSADDDHQAASALVARADPDAGKALARVLSVKHRAHYDHVPVPASAAKAAVRGARSLVEVAEEAMQA